MSFILSGEPRKISGRELFKNEILVEFKEEARGTEAVRQIEEKYGLKRTHRHLDTPFNCYIVNEKEKLLFIVEEIQKEGSVKYAQPNYIRRALYTPVAGGPNDTYYQNGSQWGFNKIMADAAYAAGLIGQFPERTVIVAVLDTGIRGTHEDLAGVTTNGYNVFNPGADPFDDDIDGGHGTHVAGIIAANTGNGTGIAGTVYANVSWNARALIMPVKVLDSEGAGTDAGVYAGIKWAVDNGAMILNYSFGGAENSQALQSGVNYAAERGRLSVAAAGNNDTAVYYPAAFSNVISVASTDEDDKRAVFSNYGKIDVSAPGTTVWSTDNGSDTAYSAYSGTSFAAPFVSGLAALIVLKYGDVGTENVRNIIEQTADDVETQGYDKYTGWGRINVLRALNRDFTPVSVRLKTYNWPNPFSSQRDIHTNITCVISEPADIRLTIYDAAGRIVYEAEKKTGEVNIGFNIIRWDGKNKDGRLAGNGTYFYTIRAGSLTGTNKITILN